LSALLSIENLVKHYPGVKAVNDVSFELGQGVCFGLLGPNGAGKTTTVEMLEGIVTPTSGQVLYRGKALGQRFRNEAGIMFQSTALQDYISVYETLTLFRRLYPVSLPLEELIETCSLGEFLDRDTRRLSGGQRQRLLLAIALVNNPHIVFLDEPTTGLDPQARHNFWDLVRRIREDGKAILLTTHYMEEAYMLCDEVAIMDRGKIIARDTPQALLAAHYNDVALQMPEDDFTGNGDDVAATVLRHDGKVEILSSDVEATIRRLIELHVPLQGLNIRPRTLEDLFLELTGKELRG